jgi:AGCS family alanine or glycine:cation symporter
VGEAATGWRIEWPNFTSAVPPELVSYDEAGDIGIYGDYAGASLTAHAFDRAVPGLGMWLVTAAAWLFALSTIISWSYYGEQGVVYLSAWLGESASNAAVLIYKFVYCALILLTTILQMPLLTDRPIIGTDTELDMWTTLGLGVMLVANIPIMLLFGAQAMKAYHSYMGKLKRGEFKAEEHKPASLSDVMEGKDVE